MNSTATDYDPAATVKALVIKPGDTTATPVDVPANNLDKMSALIGGWLEVVEIRGGIFWFDEEGKMKDLPVNALANRLLNKCGVRLPFGDQLVGPVVVTGVRKMTDGTQVAADVPAEVAVLTGG